MSKLKLIIGALSLWIKSLFINKKKALTDIQDKVFANIPYKIKGISDDGKNRIYEFEMAGTWKLLGSLIAGEMKLMMHNGKLSETRELKSTEWGNKTTLFGVINSMQLCLWIGMGCLFILKVFSRKDMTVNLLVEAKNTKTIRYKKDALIGIYIVELPHLKKAYIGQSTDTKNRLSSHRSALRSGSYAINGTARLKELQYDFNKHGESAFVFKQLLKCDPDDLLTWETYYCKLYIKEGYGLYNTFSNTEISTLACPKPFVKIVDRLIQMLDKGKLTVGELEYAIEQLEYK